MSVCLVDVVPIAKGSKTDTLTYYHSEEIPVGSVVVVPIRNRDTSAVVIGCRNAQLHKEEIRASTFSLKKIRSIKYSLYSETFIKACEKIARHYASSLGAVLYSLTPQAILTEPPEIEIHNSSKKNALPADIGAIQDTDNERIAQYRGLIRESFAHSKSVFILSPNKERSEQLIATLGKGIESFQYILHGGLGPKIQRKVWKEAIMNDHPVLIIGTLSFIGIPRTDIGVYVVENESNDGYKIPYRPFIDARKAIEYVAEARKTKLIFSDFMLRAETVHRHQSGEIQSIHPLKFRSTSQAEFSIIDMTKEPEKFCVLGSKLKDIISKLKENNEKIFIYATRKGSSPITVCNDCGKPVTNEDGTVPMVFYKDKIQGNFFLCPRTGEKRSGDEKCKNCQSWNLQPLGIGVERIKEEIEGLFPDLTVYEISKDKTKTPSQVKKIIDSFNTRASGVLIGTDLALQYLQEPISYTATTSLDSLFSLPDIGINEKIMRTCLILKNMAIKECVVQTRNITQPLFEHARTGNTLEFFREELQDREFLHFPPNFILIKITIKHPIQKILRELLDKTAEQIKGAEVFTYPAFVPKLRGIHYGHVLIKVPKKEWPRGDLISFLHSIPSAWIVSIEPESVL